MSELKVVSSAERDFDFSASDFNRVKGLIRARAGISLNDSKENMVYSRLSRRLRDTGDRNFRDYLARLDDKDHPEWQAFINALTTNLTSFFREQHHFPIFSEHVKSLRGRGKLDIWCAAASTGEEPYSIAITLLEAGIGPDRAHVLATDIDTGVLQTAAQGIYSEEAVRKLEPHLLKRYFLRGDGSFRGLYRVRPEVQALITFQQLNLLDKVWPVPRGLATIFCRNVMIYFDRPTQMDILRRFVPHMADGALLFAGHSENFHHSRDCFIARGHTVYEVVARRASGDTRDAA